LSQKEIEAKHVKEVEEISPVLASNSKKLKMEMTKDSVSRKVSVTWAWNVSRTEFTETCCKGKVLSLKQI
jgi:hypothetical protein